MKITSKLVGAGLALAGAMSLSAMSDMAQAASITQPGELVGYTWSPLPQGLYFATTGSYGQNRGGGAANAEAGVNVPVLIWSTPWTIFGARVEAYAAVPSLAAGVRGAAGGYTAAIYNPYANVGLAWDLGHGFGLSTFVGGYAPVNNALGQDYWTFNSRTGLSWSGDGWTATGHVTLGITGTNLNTGIGLGFPGSTYGFKTGANYVNVDLALLKAFGKFSIGAVAFSSADVSGISYNPGSAIVAGTTPFTGYNKQSQIAVGGFVGYDFGPVILQTYLTHDVLSHGYQGGFVTVAPGTFNVRVGGHEIYETRFFMRAIVPLYTTPAPAPVLAKY